MQGRQCWTCGLNDDGPRFIWDADITNPGDEFFHYTCIPAAIREQYPPDHPLHDMIAAAEAGQRNNELATTVHTVIAPFNAAQEAALPVAPEERL